MRILLALAFTAPFLVAPAFAASDAESGLSVTLPDTFVVETAPVQRPYAITFGVKTAAGTPAVFEGEAYLCQVSFEAVPGNAGLTRDDINAQTGTPEWIAMARNGMSAILDIEADAPFELAGYKGHEFIGKPTQKGADHVRLFLSSLETARGRTSVSCVTDAESLAAALPTFRAIRAGVTPPT